MPELALQPKQYEVLEEMQEGIASWLGLGGGRGAAKSSCIDRVALGLMMGEPGVVAAIVMRTAAQVRKYHIEPILRTWPELQDYYAVQKGKLKLPAGGKFSELDIGYAENYQAVENFFRSGNYKYIFVDQAEQFSEKELREMKKACRWPGGGAKMLLSFNMGGIGIGFLRKIFGPKPEFNEREDPKNYKFIKVNPWDNCFWVMDALTQDGLTESDYYEWTDAQRMDYASTRGEYTAQLNAEDDAIRARDWYGSWDSLEGAYFGRVFGPECTISPLQFTSLVKPWWKRWMSGDWGHSHFTSYYWHARGQVSPEDALQWLGIRTDVPLSVVITYREWVGSELSEAEIGAKLLELSDAQERGKEGYSPDYGVPQKVRALYFSPDAFELSIKRSGQNTIADEIGKVLKAGGLPYPTKANNARVPGWRAMYGLLANTKRAFGKLPELPVQVDKAVGNTLWLICENCFELIKALPLAMRDPKNLEDILKTDTTEAKIEQDAIDGSRYGILCREVSDNAVPQEAKDAEIIAKCPDNNSAMLMRAWIAQNRPKKPDGIQGW